MRIRSVVVPWWLLVLLAFGVVAMHHAPVAHAELPSSAPSAMSVHGDHLRTAAVSDTSSLTSVDEEAGMGHGTLHLCLAVLAGALAMCICIASQIFVERDSLSHRSVLPAGIARARPVVPVPRKLAVLCVFRL